MKLEPFAVPTRDRRTRLAGVVELPCDEATVRHPFVVMVPGGWFMDRDGYMGGSGTERDLIYKDLAQDYLAAGIAVVRYDNRGVRCNEMTMPPCPEGSSEIEITRHYLNSCIDADVRQTVTVQSQMDDVEDVWQFALAHASLDPARGLIWAHSEGGLNVARLIDRWRIEPRGVQLVGSITESPAAVFRWQAVERYADHVMEWDGDGDGCVTSADVERCLPGDEMFAAVGMGREDVPVPAEGWTRETLVEHFAEKAERMREETFARPDDTPYPPAGEASDLRVVAASNNWFKQWFED